MTHVIAKNLIRRHLDESGPALVTHRLSAATAQGWPGKAAKDANLRLLPTPATATELLRVSQKSVSHASKIFSENSSAVPQRLQAVDLGRIRVGDASAIVRQSPEIQRQVVNLVANDEAKNLKSAVKQWQRDGALPDRPSGARAGRFMALGEVIILHQAPVACPYKLVEPASVDIIITNPPRDLRSLPLIDSLAAFADHALQPTGAIGTIAGMINVPQVFELLNHPDLKWVAEFNYRYGNRGRG